MYTGIMSAPSWEGGPGALGSRLAELKRWPAWDAGISVHSAVCVVNGEATDATRNATVLMGCRGRPHEREDLLPVHRLPAEYGFRLQEGRGGAVRPVQHDDHLLQEMKKADGAVKRGRGLADGMAGREDERPPPGRLAAPVTVSCRATFLAFLIHQRFSNEE